MKKIIGFKLKKIYPGSGNIGDEVRIRNTGTKAFWYIPIQRVYMPEETLINFYSEFYEPIYEEETIDLDKIFNDIFIGKAPWYDFKKNHALCLQGTVKEMMKEACKQTLELVKKEIRIKRVATYNIIEEKDIDKIFEKIK